MTPASAPTSSPVALKPRRPSMLNALGEFRVPLEASIYWLAALAYPWPRVEPPDSKVVMLIPGFMAGDVTLAPLASFADGSAIARSTRESGRTPSARAKRCGN